MSELNNIIGRETTVKGNLKTKGNIRIEGIFIGEVTTQAKIVLAASAKVEGNILAKNAEISGEIKGKIVVSSLLVLKSTAKIYGDINTVQLICEEGAKFNGQCNMMPKDAKKSSNLTDIDINHEKRNILQKKI